MGNQLRSPTSLTVCDVLQSCLPVCKQEKSLWGRLLAALPAFHSHLGTWTPIMKVSPPSCARPAHFWSVGCSWENLDVFVGRWLTFTPFLSPLSIHPCVHRAAPGWTAASFPTKRKMLHPAGGGSEPGVGIAEMGARPVPHERGMQAGL